MEQGCEWLFFFLEVHVFAFVFGQYLLVCYFRVAVVNHRFPVSVGAVPAALLLLCGSIHLALELAGCMVYLLVDTVDEEANENKGRHEHEKQEL